MSLQLGNVSIDRFLVLGLGTTGKAVCQYAHRRGVSVRLSDHRSFSDAEREWLFDRRISYEEGGHTVEALGDVDAVVLSPSIPVDLPLLEEARRRGIPVLSEFDLASLAGCTRPMIAVTGTNGKSSTVELVGGLLRALTWRVPVVGNIGTPLIGVVEHSCDAVVIEASSYQLAQSSIFRPDVGVLLNLEPDHLSWHKTMAAYADAKGRLFRLQASGDTAILPRALDAKFRQGAARRVFYDDPQFALPDGAKTLPLHQQDNLRAALCACSAVCPDVDWQTIATDGVVERACLPYRMQQIGFVDRIRVVNDSKATNPAATIAALGAIDGPVILMLGGRAKQAGYEQLRKTIETSPIRRVVLFGEAAEQLALALSGIQVEVALDLGSAIRVALDVGEPEDTLLFSPACSSFDQFCSFEERGAVFSHMIRVRTGFHTT